MLRAAAKKNHSLTSNLVGILDSFEDRVGRLQDTILPVYKQTEALQFKQQSMLLYLIFYVKMRSKYGGRKPPTALHCIVVCS